MRTDAVIESCTYNRFNRNAICPPPTSATQRLTKEESGSKTIRRKFISVSGSAEIFINFRKIPEDRHEADKSDLSQHEIALSYVLQSDHLHKTFLAAACQ